MLRLKIKQHSEYKQTQTGWTQVLRNISYSATDTRRAIRVSKHGDKSLSTIWHRIREKISSTITPNL
jgi:hypothetical protein